MAGSRAGSCWATVGSRSAAAWLGCWHGRVLVNAECARGQLTPCPGAWALPSSVCWRSPCRGGPEVSSGAGDGGLWRWVGWGSWESPPATPRGSAPAGPQAGSPGFVPTLCARGGGGDAGDPEQAENSRSLPGLPPSLSFSSVFLLLAFLSAAFLVSPLFSSLCVCAYKYILIKLEPYHRYCFVSCICHFTL